MTRLRHTRPIVVFVGVRFDAQGNVGRSRGGKARGVARPAPTGQAASRASGRTSRSSRAASSSLADSKS